MEEIFAVLSLIKLGLFLVGNALFIFGLSKLLSEKMIFGRIGAYVQSKIGETASKPLFACPPCMASVWGSAWFAIFIGEWLILPLYLILLVGLVRFMMNLSPDWW